jgi:pilus assembly protein CpaF
MGLLEPVRRFLEANDVAEVLINGPDEIYVERRGRLELTDARFESVHALEAAVRNIAQFVGRQVGPERPVLEARLPDGSRVEAIMPPVSRKGIIVAIRKFSKDTISCEALVKLGSLSASASRFLEACIRVKRNILIAGGTGSGKTALLAALAAALPDHERIVVIEDSSELKLRQPHVVSLEGRPPNAKGEGAVTIRELLRATLRLRPDRIVVGEVRAGEALDLVQSMISGHGGGLSTVHATRPADALRRLETLALMSDVGLPLAALRSQIASAIDIIVLIERMQDGTRKITHVAEALGLDETGNYVVSELFVYDLQSIDERTGRIQGELRPTGVAPSFWHELAAHGEQLDRELDELWTGALPE